MNAQDGFNRAQFNHDNQLPPEDSPEPSEAHIEEAFAQLVQDSDLLNTFMLETDVTITGVYQLFHANGWPTASWSERNDELRDSYALTFEIFFDHYRSWLGDRLTAKADEVMRAQIEEARIEAEEYAADCRRDDREM
jgi:hypothetical protein